MAQFRRPASLSPQRQEAIEGGVDPALKNQAAHESAAALLRETRENARPEVVERVLKLVEREGLEDLAALWSGAEPASLPGALWRLYVLHTWVQRDTDEVRRLFELGQSTAPGLTYLVGFSDPPTIDSMRVTLDAILSGAFTGDLSVALSRAAAVAMLAAYGSAHAADSPASRTELARSFGTPATPEELTTRADRLLKTGEALNEAARSAAAGTLA